MIMTRFLTLFFAVLLIAAFSVSSPPSHGLLLVANKGDRTLGLIDPTAARQIATVAEPLNLQGWIMIDEINRAFAGEKPSGFVPHVHLFTADNIEKDGGKENKFDPDNGYRNEYRKIWGVK